MADQIALLRHGHISAIGTPRDLYTHPRDEPTARFLGAANLLAAKVVAAELHCPIPLPTQPVELADGAYTILLRPEHLAITTQPTPGAAEATIVTVSYQGPTSQVHLKLDTSPAAEIMVQAPGTQHITAGHKVWVRATHPGILWPESPQPTVSNLRWGD